MKTVVLLCRFSVDPVVMNLHQIEKFPMSHKLPTDNSTDSDLGKWVFDGCNLDHLFDINRTIPFNQSTCISTLLWFEIVSTVFRGEIDKRVAVPRPPPIHFFPKITTFYSIKRTTIFHVFILATLGNYEVCSEYIANILVQLLWHRLWGRGHF